MIPEVKIGFDAFAFHLTQYIIITLNQSELESARLAGGIDAARTMVGGRDVDPKNPFDSGSREKQNNTSILRRVSRRTQ